MGKILDQDVLHIGVIHKMCLLLLHTFGNWNVCWVRWLACNRRYLPYRLTGAKDLGGILPSTYLSWNFLGGSIRVHVWSLPTFQLRRDEAFIQQFRGAHVQVSLSGNPVSVKACLKHVIIRYTSRRDWYLETLWGSWQWGTDNTTEEGTTIEAIEPWISKEIIKTNQT